MSRFKELYGRLPLSMRTALENCEQDKLYHPEGCVDAHIRMVFEYAETNYSEDVELLLAALFHDLGKPETKSIKSDGFGHIRIRNIGHEYASLKYIDMYFDLYSDISTNKEKVYEICKEHMRAWKYYSKEMSNKGKRKAFEELKYFPSVIKFTICDHEGRGKTK